MRRGDISNQPEPMCLVDYRTVFDRNADSEAIVQLVPDLLLSPAFGSKACKFYALKKGAASWFDRNAHRRIILFTVGLHDAECMALDATMELQGPTWLSLRSLHHFHDRIEFHEHVRSTPQVMRVVTADPDLIKIGVSPIYRPLSNWGEAL